MNNYEQTIKQLQRGEITDAQAAEALNLTLDETRELSAAYQRGTKEGMRGEVLRQASGAVLEILSRILAS